MKVFRVCFCLLLGITLILSVGVVQADPEENSSRIQGLEERVEYLEESLATALNILNHFRYEDGEINGLRGPHVVFIGANLHVQNGLGSSSTVNGVGNLIVGYNEAYSDTVTSNRGGSHNLVVGRNHEYPSRNGFVAGRENKITDRGATVTGGRNNQALYDYSTVTGGINNQALGDYSSVSGGRYNKASGFGASVTGGFENTTNNIFATVTGGYGNTASHDFASVNGGWYNTASENGATVSGGENLSTTYDGQHVP